MVLSPHDGAWGHGAMGELNFGCNIPPCQELAYCRVSKSWDHHRLQDGASQPTYGSWCHHVLYEKGSQAAGSTTKGGIQ